MDIFQAWEFDKKIENYLRLQMDSLFLLGQSLNFKGTSKTS